MSYNTFCLPNGLRIIHKYEPISEISYSGFAINVGSRDEDINEFGMAHFIEHMMFKGTKKRKYNHILSWMDKVGGELNAYTTKEETFIYSIFLDNYLDRAINLLTDIVFNSHFPESELEKEKGVVLDEISSYIDSPADLIYDDFENNIYSNHNLGHYVLGTKKSVNSFNSNNINKFFKQKYNPSNMVFFFLGKTPFEKVIKILNKYLLTTESHFTNINRHKPIEIDSKLLVYKKRTKQSHIIMGCRTFDMYNKNKLSLIIANNIIGGGTINNRLNNCLREKNGLVYNVESNATFYTDTGYFSIYFASDLSHIERCIKLINKETDALCNGSLTNKQLLIAKTQCKSQLAIYSENKESFALDMAKRFLHFNNNTSIQDVYQKIDSVTLEDVNKIFNDILKSKDFFKLVYK